jgi:hypothetical protein
LFGVRASTGAYGTDQLSTSWRLAPRAGVMMHIVVHLTVHRVSIRSVIGRCGIVVMIVVTMP